MDSSDLHNMIVLQRDSTMVNVHKEKKCRGGKTLSKLESSLKRTYGVRKVHPIAKGGVICPFPWKLHEMLDFIHENGLQNIACWNSDGHSFTVTNINAFVEDIMPLFFLQTKFTSFQRQLNLYGFRRNRNSTHACYSHEFFVRGHPELVASMTRTKIKGNGPKRGHVVSSRSSASNSSKSVPKKEIKTLCDPVVISPLERRDVISPLTNREWDWDRIWLPEQEDWDSKPSSDGLFCHWINPWLSPGRDDPADTISLVADVKSNDSIEKWWKIE